MKRSSPELPLGADGVDEVANILSPLKAVLPADHILNVLRNSPSGLTAKRSRINWVVRAAVLVPV